MVLYWEQKLALRPDMWTQLLQGKSLRLNKHESEFAILLRTVRFQIILHPSEQYI